MIIKIVRIFVVHLYSNLFEGIRLLLDDTALLLLLLLLFDEEAISPDDGTLRCTILPVRP